MLTLKDIRNPKRTSGYNNVGRDLDSRLGRTNPNPWRAGIASGGPNGNKVWRGPRRATPEEAAQDYCDRINGTGATASVRLVTPNHPKRSPGRMSAKERKLAAELRKAREERRAKEPRKQGTVYLIGMKGNNYAAKIGHSTDTRLAELQTGNPYELVLLGQIPGTEDDERALHARFIEDNVMLEWFRLTPEVLSTFDAREGDPLD